MYIKCDISATKVDKKNLKEEIVVVIDVLRATTTMVTALAHGIKGIKTFGTIEEAREYKRINPSVILGGERNAEKPSDFDCGNSPLEYLNFVGREVALTTTNGTVAIANAKGATEILIMSMHNYKATVEYLVKKAMNIRFICAGTDGEFSLDDALCAGLAINIFDESTYNFDDMSKLLAYASESNKEKLMKEAKHYKILEGKKYYKDLDWFMDNKEYDFVAVILDGEVRKVEG